MKIGIIAFSPIRYLPYLRKYCEILNGCGQPYDVICFDREGEDQSHDNVHVFSARCIDAPRYKKLAHFVRYNLFVRKILRKNRYDRLIVLTTLPAVLLADVLLRRYAGRFLFDYRDASYEHVPPYGWLVRRLAKAAALTCISSPGFKRFLPTDRLVLSHNASRDVLAEGDSPVQGVPFANAGRIVLTYMGHIGYFPATRHLVEKLANVAGMELRVIGLGSDGLRRAAGNLEAANVLFRGRFGSEEKLRLYADTDLVVNTYGDYCDVVRYALSNKLYEAARYGRPLLVSKNTLMQDYAEQYSLGLAVDLERDNVADAIQSYATGFNWEAFQAGGRKLLDEARRDEGIFVRKVIEFCQGGTP